MVPVRRKVHQKSEEICYSDDFFYKISSDSIGKSSAFTEEVCCCPHPASGLPFMMSKTW